MENILKNTPQKIAAWLTDKVTTASGMRRNILANTKRATNNIMIGKMFFYFYDPKHKKTLPIYDRFPLVLPMEQYSDGFLGLNLHYLDIKSRSALLGELLKHRNNNLYDERTKIQMSYSLLAKTKTLALASPCIKRYLYNHVRSPFVEVTPEEWDKAIGLPVAIFVRKP